MLKQMPHISILQELHPDDRKALILASKVLNSIVNGRYFSTETNTPREKDQKILLNEMVS